MIFWLEGPRLTQSRVLVARESEADLAKATEKLREHLQFNQATHNTLQMIEILLKPFFQIPKTQYSNIPSFHFSPATAGLGVNPCFKKLTYLQYVV
jgi:hypothetical protein